MTQSRSSAPRRRSFRGQIVLFVKGRIRDGENIAGSEWGR